MWRSQNLQISEQNFENWKILFCIEESRNWIPLPTPSPCQSFFPIISSPFRTFPLFTFYHLLYFPLLYCHFHYFPTPFRHIFFPTPPHSTSLLFFTPSFPPLLSFPITQFLFPSLIFLTPTSFLILLFHFHTIPLFIFYHLPYLPVLYYYFPFLHPVPSCTFHIINYFPRPSTLLSFSTPPHSTSLLSFTPPSPFLLAFPISLFLLLSLPFLSPTYSPILPFATNTFPLFTSYHLPYFALKYYLSSLTSESSTTSHPLPTLRLLTYSPSSPTPPLIPSSLFLFRLPNPYSPYLTPRIPFYSFSLPAT